MPHPWRDHPKLHGRFHPQHPDDVQVLVHDGGPRLTTHKPELVWVTVTGCRDDVFTGRVLNQPQQLSSVKQGSEIRFLVPEGGEFPLLVTDKYLRERPCWTIHPCNRCGLTELFDAPSDLVKAAFPILPEGAALQMLTAFCGACGGVQLVQPKDALQAETAANPPTRRWWQFWR